MLSVKYKLASFSANYITIPDHRIQALYFLGIRVKIEDVGRDGIAHRILPICTVLFNCYTDFSSCTGDIRFDSHTQCSMLYLV